MGLRDRKLLILDLDETLIHATEKNIDGQSGLTYGQYNIYQRPYLAYFLSSVSAHYLLAIWSSADDLYVKNIVEMICPKEIDFQFVWGRSRCTKKWNYELDQYVCEKRLKKVKKLGYKLDNILILDDSPEKARDNYGNAVYINPYEGDPQDIELKFLCNYLKSIQSLNGFRKLDKREWKSKI